MRLVREVSFALAVIGAAWMTWLIVVGGFEVRIFNETITSNEPVRPFLLASAALALFIWSGSGADRAWEWIRQACAGAQKLRVQFELRVRCSLIALSRRIAGPAQFGPDVSDRVKQILGARFAWHRDGSV